MDKEIYLVYELKFERIPEILCIEYTSLKKPELNYIGKVKVINSNICNITVRPLTNSHYYLTLEFDDCNKEAKIENENEKFIIYRNKKRETIIKPTNFNKNPRDLVKEEILI